MVVKTQTARNAAMALAAPDTPAPPLPATARAAAPASPAAEHGRPDGGRDGSPAVARRARRAAPLGIHAEVPDYAPKANPRASRIKEIPDAETGEIQQWRIYANPNRAPDLILSLEDLGAKRWDLWYKSRALFRSYGMKAVKNKAGETVNRWKYRVADCHSRIPGQDVELWKHERSLSARKVARCGNAYFCNICGGRVAAVRRKMIETVQQAVFDHPAKGRRGSTWMLTLTIPHTGWDDPQELFRDLRAALDKLTGNGDLFKAGRWVSNQRGKYWRPGKLDSFGFVGHIVATEITWSPHNGAHPHFHCLLAFDRELLDDAFSRETGLASEETKLRDLFRDTWKRALGERWQAVCDRYRDKAARMGELFDESKMDAKLIDFREALDVDEYLTKFGFEKASPWAVTNELTSNTKRGRKADSKTLLDLVNDAVTGFDAEGKATLDSDKAELVRKLSDALKGRPVVTFSRRLRAWLRERGIDDLEKYADMTDEEVAQLNDQEAQQFAIVPAEVWDEVVRSRSIQVFFNRLLAGLESEEAIFGYYRDRAKGRPKAAPLITPC